MARRRYLFAAAISLAVLLFTVPGSAVARSHRKHRKHHTHHVVPTTKRGLSSAGATKTSTATGVALAAPTTTSPATTCRPPGPTPGSTINGGLDVTGPCRLHDVLVNGGLVVESAGGVELENSTVIGPTVVRKGGELDSGHILTSNTNTGTPSTFNGGIEFDQGFDMDLTNAVVNGGVNVSGPTQGGIPTICGTRINGGFTLTGMTSLVYGDPGEPLDGGTPADCPGNTIIGPVTVRNSSGLEVEGNNIVGSTSLSGSQIDFWGNQVVGSLLCNQGSMLINGDGDATPNSVLGPNTCP